MKKEMILKIKDVAGFDIDDFSVDVKSCGCNLHVIATLQIAGVSVGGCLQDDALITPASVALKKAIEAGVLPDVKIVGIRESGDGFLIRDFDGKPLNPHLKPTGTDLLIELSWAGLRDHKGRFV